MPVRANSAFSNDFSTSVITQKLHCVASASSTGFFGASSPPYFFAKYRLIAIDSHTMTPSSSMAGIRWFGLIALYASDFASLAKLVATCSYGTPHSSTIQSVRAARLCGTP